jgi:glycine/D-amino acid oxidase-like deaminating enzyme
MQGQFHPTKYLNGVASAIAKHGGTLYTDTRVTEIGDEVKGQPIRVGTRTGYSVYADKVVIATNAPIKDNALVYGKQVSERPHTDNAHRYVVTYRHHIVRL